MGVRQRINGLNLCEQALSVFAVCTMGTNLASLWQLFEDVFAGWKETELEPEPEASSSPKTPRGPPPGSRGKAQTKPQPTDFTPTQRTSGVFEDFSQRGNHALNPPICRYRDFEHKASIKRVTQEVYRNIDDCEGYFVTDPLTETGMEHEFFIQTEKIDSSSHYYCCLCPSDYKSKSTLANHYRRFHLGICVQCEFCPHRTFSPTGMVKHAKDIHRVDLTTSIGYTRSQGTYNDSVPPKTQAPSSHQYFDDDGNKLHDQTDQANNVNGEPHSAVIKYEYNDDGSPSANEQSDNEDRKDDTLSEDDEEYEQEDDDDSSSSTDFETKSKTKKIKQKSKKVKKSKRKTSSDSEESPPRKRIKKVDLGLIAQRADKADPNTIVSFTPPGGKTTEITTLKKAQKQLKKARQGFSLFWSDKPIPYTVKGKSYKCNYRIYY